MKTQSQPAANFDDYIAAFSPEVQTILQQIRRTIQEVAPEATEAIKYQIPTFVFKENLVHFAAYKYHIGFYPSPRALERFKAELAGYKGSKGAVQFPLDKPIPYDLIRRIAEFRRNEVMG